MEINTYIDHTLLKATATKKATLTIISLMCISPDLKRCFKDSISWFIQILL